MIRVLITCPLNPEVVDRLNEIPEFEVSEKSGLSAMELRREIAQAEALVCGAIPPVTAQVLQEAAGLRLIIPVGAENGVDAAAAAGKRIEVRPIAAGTAGTEQTIAILKDFFNV